jgi:hypothetical protein
MQYIKQLVQNSTVKATRRNTNPGNGIDVHCQSFFSRCASAPLTTVLAHLVFPWYRQLVPTTGGEPTPDWDTASHLAFAAQEG